MHTTVEKSTGVAHARRRRAVRSSGALLAVGALVATLMAGSPAAATDYPSWDDVLAAKSSETAKSAQIAELQGLISGLEAEVSAAEAVADQAWQADQVAQQALAEGTRKADELRAGADAAAARSEESNRRAAALAGQFARSAGNDLTSRLMVSGDGSDDLL